MAHDPLNHERLEAAQQTAADRSRLKASDAVSDLLWLMSSKRGRRFIHRLLAESRVHQLSYCSNAQDTAFREGERNWGLKTYARIRSDPKLVELEAQMNKEQLSERDDDADDGRESGGASGDYSL